MANSAQRLGEGPSMQDDAELTRRSLLLSSLGALALPSAAWGQAASNAPESVAGIPVNYDEERVGTYRLPEPLVAQDGTRIETAGQWWRKRRPEILRFFETQQFGIAPARARGMRATVVEPPSPAFGGKGIRKQIRIALSDAPGTHPVDLVLYTPAGRDRPVPVLLTINFSTSAAVVDDPGLRPGMVWDRTRHRRLPYEGEPSFLPKIDPVPLLEAGIGFAAFYYGDVEPDDPEGFADGIRARYLKPGQTKPEPDQWGAISAWAWGISRVIDHLETEPAVDPKRIAIQGVSRLGKTVMWAGARDPRVRLTIASASGEGGAAISSRNYGETIAHLVAPTRYPYQFAANYARWAGFPDRTPMDGNLLVALHAPKPLLLQTGTTDGWSDPKGEFLSAVDAGQVYRLLGARDLGTGQWPGPGQRLFGDLSYYMHAGGHGPIPADWPVFLDFLKMHLLPLDPSSGLR